MTAPWDAGPCDWPDGDQLDRQLAEADRAASWPRRFNPYQPITGVVEGSL